jgi:hypothetical protein
VLGQEKHPLPYNPDPRRRRSSEAHTIVKLIGKANEELPSNVLTRNVGQGSSYSVVESSDDDLAASHTLLDADLHTDTVTGTATRGDIIVANATPKFARVAKGTTGRFLQCDANDTAWSAWSLPATAPDNGDFLCDDGTWTTVSAWMKQDFNGNVLCHGNPTETWTYGAHPNASDVLVPQNFPQFAFDYTNKEGTTNDGLWRWNARYIVEEPLTSLFQVWLAVGVNFEKQGSLVLIKARVKLNDADNFDWVKLYCNDDDNDGDGQLSADFKASADGIYYEATLDLSLVNISGWTDNLRAGVVAQGFDWTTEGSYDTRIYVERITVLQK